MPQKSAPNLDQLGERTFPVGFFFSAAAFTFAAINAVPEPSTWVLLGLGAGFVAIIQGRRKRLIPNLAVHLQK